MNWLSIWSTICIIISIEIENPVSARVCGGGSYKCSSPKECCPQGCCYLYAPPNNNTPKLPNTDHVLNWFFINHWYFWCLMVAIIFALVLFCFLWSKRRQICGWNSPRLRSQSEGSDLYSVPPHYSRCSSFHQPPPYTEVTSKPDLYPLVFSFTGEDKAGTNYLMVQYFHNYIVRPTGSLSETSTVESLSSSFICNGNAPPSYSRAQSPNLSISIQSHYIPQIPRSASALDDVNNVSNTRLNSLPNTHFKSTIITSNIESFASEIFDPKTSQRKTTENQQTFQRLIDNCSRVGEINENKLLLNKQNNDYKSTIKNVQFKYYKNYDSNNNFNNINVSREQEIFNSCNSIDVSVDVYTHFNIHQPSCYTQQKQHEQEQQKHHCNQNDLMNRYECYLNSNNHSIVSSLTNMESLSPPIPESPTTEIKDLLEQIHIFHNDPIEYQSINLQNSIENVGNAIGNTSCAIEKVQRPSSLLGRNNQFFNINRKKNASTMNNSKTLKSPMEFFFRKGFISKSAPSTPNQLPYYKPDDCSQIPLLNENDED